MAQKIVFNAPPGWPRPSKDWLPPEGWQPDPSWPPAPAGWEFFRLEQPRRVPLWVKRVIVPIVVGAVALGWAYADGKSSWDAAPKVGECAKTINDKQVQKVDCASADAAYVVTSTHQGEDDPNICANDPDATIGWSASFQVRSSDISSFVICGRDQ